MRLQLIEKFEKMREQGMMDIKQAKAGGTKVVGMYCAYSPQELVLAAGALPVTLCGTKNEPIATAEKVLPRNLCPLLKSSYGFAATDTCPFFYFSDLLIAETTCDGKKKMYELLAEYKPMHILQLPQTQDDAAAKELWIIEIRKTKARLEQEFGVIITDEALRAVIRLVNRERTALKKLYELAKENPAPLSGLDVLTIVWNRGFYVNREEVIRMLEELVVEVEVTKNTSVDNSIYRPRILVTGVPIGLGSEKVIRLIEGLGATIVIQDNCTGYKPIDRLVDEDESKDPIVAIAEKYLSIPCSCMSPNHGRYELLGRLINEYKIDGVVDLVWTACHTYNIEAFSIRKFIKEQFDKPVLQIETDYSSSDTEQLKVRIEAFLEILK